MGSDLIATLRTGRIAGARIDVYDEQAPILDYPFRSLDNVTAAPHLGYMTRPTRRVFCSDTAKALIAFANRVPIRVADAAALAHARH
jgi:phosphoglycerate dehydrogenase-like enzyme